MSDTFLPKAFISLYLLGIVAWVFIHRYRISKSNLKASATREAMEFCILLSPAWPVFALVLVPYYLLVALPARILIKD